MKNTSIDNSATLYELNILGTGDFVMPDFTAGITISNNDTIQNNGMLYLKTGWLYSGNATLKLNDTSFTLGNGTGSGSNSQAYFLYVGANTNISFSGIDNAIFYPIKGA